VPPPGGVEHPRSRRDLKRNRNVPGTRRSSLEDGRGRPEIFPGPRKKGGVFLDRGKVVEPSLFNSSYDWPLLAGTHVDAPSLETSRVSLTVLDWWLTRLEYEV